MKLSAKDVVLKFIRNKEGTRFIEAHHYSGKIASSGMFFIGCFLNEKLVGCFQYGRPIDKYKVKDLVRNTKWNDFLELNRLVFIENTPMCIESRSIAISFRLIKKHYKNIKWILSFADACQCGSGTIYRASGFYLTGIKKNSSLIRFVNGMVLHKKVFESGQYGKERKEFLESGYSRWQDYVKAKYGNFEILNGYQLRYIKLLYDDLELSVPKIPFSELDKLNFPYGVRHKKRASSVESGTSLDQREGGGESPTDALQIIQMES